MVLAAIPSLLWPKIMVKSKHNFEVVAETILDFKMAAIYNEYNEHQSYRIPLISMPFGQ